MKSLTQLFTAAVVSLVLAATAFAGEVVDINRASAQELAAGLVGVGPAKAEAIVEYRERNGDFRSIEELAEVRGIGLALVERNAERMEAGPSRRGGRGRDD
ncbi:MAG: ComEA family DNA-binding protein [Lysobacteraceae bacterium]